MSSQQAQNKGGGQSRRFADINAPAGSPKFSPDGKWLAYCSNESGKPQVYVQAFPGPGAKIQVSNDGGTDPVWKRSGGELYFRDGDKMMAVTVSTECKKASETWMRLAGFRACTGGRYSRRLHRHMGRQFRP